MTPYVLIVAGSDSSGGAGIVRDVETVSSFGLRSSIAVTAVTVQTHQAVERIEQMPPELVAEQMRTAFAANPVAAVKIGMLGTAATIDTVASVLASSLPVSVVLDPICPPELTSRLNAYLRDAGADVRLEWHEGGHEVRPNEIDAAKRFFATKEQGQ